MTKKRKYFPNKWKALQAAPSQHFDSITYDDFMDWKTSGWVLPHEVSCIIREENIHTGKIKEYVYKTDLGAKRKIKKLMDVGASEFIICNVDTVCYMKPELTTEDTDEDYYEEAY
tara:strand:- start:1854 stop:2198 length:345 start_codon:yes stop_codon:yes gene_type:complete